MAVLVTGGAGYIGSHMALELLDAGERVIVLDDLSTGFRSLVPAKAVFLEGDIGDQALLHHIIHDHDISEVIHFAAKLVVPDSLLDPCAYYKTNVSKTQALLDVLIENKIKKFIFSSSASVYGNPQSNPVAENAHLAPLSPYGRSKLMVEWMLEDLSRAYDFSCVALRYFNVAGADPKARSGQCTHNATQLIKVICQAALGIRPSVLVYGADYPTPDGTCIRDFIQVTDLCRAHLAALRYLRNNGKSDVFNVGYGKGYSVFETVEALRRIAQRDVKVEIAPRRAGDPAVVIAENHKITATLGWEPLYNNLDDIIRQAFTWEKKIQMAPDALGFLK